MNLAPRNLLAAAAMALAPAASFAQAYVQVFPLSAVPTSGVTTPFLDTVVASGPTAYAVLRDNSAAVGGSVSAFSGGSFSPVMTFSQWTGSVDTATQLGANVVGSKLRSVNFLSNSVWEIDLGTGVPTEVVPKATIDGVTGLSTSLGAQFETLASGDIFAYVSNNNSRQIIQISPSNAVTVEIPVASMTASFGVANATVNGLGALGSTIYLGSNSTDSIVAWDTVGNTGSVALSTAQISAVTGVSTVGFDDIFGAPDGYVYFKDTQSDSVLRFLPSNPAGSLAKFLSSSDLLSGPAASVNLDQMTWWNGALAWTQAASTSGQVPGFYAVIPEPASASLVGAAAAGLLAIRRRV